MKHITDYIGRELKGRQPNAFKMEYELLAGEDLVAALRFRSAWGTLATAQSADGCWTFKRVGFFQTRITIRPCDSENELAVFRNNTWSSGGTLELPAGRKYLASSNFWATQYDFRTEEGTPMIHFQQEGILNLSTRITLLPEASNIPELPWMTLLGWYLVIMMQNDASAGATAASVSVMTVT